MIKSVSYPATDRIKIITRAMFGDLSSSEFKVLLDIVIRQAGGTLPLTKLTIDYMMEDTGLSRSGLSTAIDGLKEKGVIKKESKTVILHPIYVDVDNLEGLVLKFIN